MRLAEEFISLLLSNLYLVDWDTSLSMMPLDEVGTLPIHRCRFMDINGFMAFLEAGLRHYPKELGGLYYKRKSDGATPYGLACHSYGKEQVDKDVDHCLAEHQYYIGETASSLIFAAAEDTVALVAVYFLLQRDVSILANAAPSPGHASG